MTDSNYRETNPSYSLIPSINVLRIYGTPRSTALYVTNNHWVVPADQRDIFSTYYLLRWKASYFQDKIHEGTIEREGVIYQVIYYRCNAAAIGKDSRQLLLSFRELQKEYSAHPVVLVTVA